jgi:hypothetical protein
MHRETERQFYRTLVRVERMMESNEARATERQRQASIKVEWQLVSTVVDRALLIVFVATTVGVTLAVLLGAPHAREFLFGTGPNDAAAAPHTPGSSVGSTGASSAGGIVGNAVTGSRLHFSNST